MKKILKLFCVIIFFGSIHTTKAQKIEYKEKASKKNSNFFKIVKETRKQFLEKEYQYKGEESRSQKKERKQFERWVYAWKDRVNSDGTFPKNQINKEEYLELLMNNSNTQAKTSSTTKAWQQIGPSTNVEQNGYAEYPGLGRVNVVAVDANSTNTMYAGACAGGVWKTTDGGTTWVAKTDNFAGLGVTDIIIDPNNSNILYMATGDEDAQHISSIGVFKSIDAGDTWAATGLTFTLNQNEYVRDLSFAPGSSTTIFALTNNEVKKSTDSGATWTNKPAGSYTGDRFQNIIFDPNDATKVIVSDAYYTIYFSTDSGENFTEHSVYSNLSGKLKLTSSANDTENFYALHQNGTVYKFRYAMQNNAADKISETTISGFNSQGGYNQCLAVSPTDKNNILVGGVNGYRSTDNGATFSGMLDAYNGFAGTDNFYVHPDHHHLSFLADGVTVINGHDGGVHKGAFSATSVSGGWTDLTDGLVISQSYNISITQGINGDDYMMGNQDNDGFSKVFQTDARKWVSCLAGDGTGTGIDIDNPAIRYLGGTKGSLYRSDDGYASSWQPSAQILASDANAAFVSALALHPTVAATIYAGHSDVKKSTNRGTSWTALTSGLTETSFLDVSLYNDSADIRIFAIGDSGGNSTLKRSINDGSSWTTISSPAGVTINSVYAVPNSDVVYATVSSYTVGSKVYKSTDNGANWTNMSGNLPNIIMYKIILDPNKTIETLYLGTELGMYFTVDSGTTWSKLGTALPNVRISDIEVSKNNGNIYIGTFGRGLWVYDDQKYFDNVTDTNWSTTANWEGSSLPTAADDVFLKSTENVILNTDGANVKSLEIEDGALLTIDNTRDLTVENNFSTTSSTRVVKINSDATDAGVLIVKGTSTGQIEFERGGMLQDKWHLVSVPLEGQKIKSFADNVNNSIRVNTTPDPDRYAIGYYDDSQPLNSKWVYYDKNIDVNTAFAKTKSYAMSRGSAGSVSFTGTLLTDNQTSTVVANEWNAIGNPFTAYYPANKNSNSSFLNDNTASLSEQAVYVWDGNQEKYDALSDLAPSAQKGLQPGQGFFVKTNVAVTSLSFSKDKRLTKPVTGDNVFNKSEVETPFIELFVKNGNIEVKTVIIYDDNATIGLDSKYDILNFDSSNFDLTTQLLEANLGKNYTIQSIPNNDFENQVIPVNLRVAANKEVVFRVKPTNLPDELNVYLEDKETNLFHKLSNDDSHKITTTKELNSIGRFYIHVSRSSLTTNDIELDKVSVFNFNKELFINGLDEGVLNIKLFDISGKQIVSENQKAQGKNSLQLNKLSSGIYLVKVSYAKNTITKKIILN
ncbi:MAG: hypothetical protein ACJA1B_001182 [Polaribacter sp.]|jgi:hypothetical protein